MKRSLLVVAALALSACSLNSTEPQDNPSDPATETFAAQLGVNIATMKKTVDGVYYKDVTVGTGDALPIPTSGATEEITVSYAGFLKDGTLFDTSANNTDGTATFDLGGTVAGFQEGTLGILASPPNDPMHVGGERLIVIPSELGYGPQLVTGTFGTVPPNSTLVFDVKLVNLD